MIKNMLNMWAFRCPMAEEGEVNMPAEGGGAVENGGGTENPADNGGGTENGTPDNGGENGAGKPAEGDGGGEKDDWDLNAEPTEKKEDAKPDEGEAKEGGEKKKDFALVLPEGYKPDEGALKAATAAAKQFGVDPKSMGLVMRAMDAAADKAYKAELKADAARLRDDWGTSYEDNLKETRTFVKNLEQTGILPEHMKNALNSPEGVRFLHGLSRMVSEDKPMSGVVQETSAMNDARDIMNNPNNPLHEKWVNGDPEVSRRVDRGLGLPC